jgi:hypothetical protein
MLVFRVELALVGLLLASPGLAAAAGPTAGDDAAPPGGEPAPELDVDDLSQEYRTLAQAPGRASRLVGTLGVGEGVRFNNPYRLQTQLGEDAESVSLTSGYLDLGAAFALGPADGLQHGAALHWSIALSGVRQQAIAPSYFVACRGPMRLLGYGRLGASILTSPDVNVGGEIAGGLGYFLTARLAISGEIVGNLFYGAATYEATYTVYPVVSAQLGLMIDHELLP